MLERYLIDLCSELSIDPVPEKGNDGGYLLELNRSVSARLRDLSPGISMESLICTKPNKNVDDLYIWLMRANLLGQGTGGCRIGLDPEEKTLTLSLGLPYETNYRTFRDRFEEFINYTLYFREEIKTYEKEGIYPQ